jgi:hypothetical protein
MKSRAAIVVLVSCVAVIAEPPRATGDRYGIDEDGVLEVGVAEGVRANDAPGSAREPAAGLVGAPLHGTVALNPD